MLNQNNERELAYVVKVGKIHEIDGYDRVEFAEVNGWGCIVPKGAFKEGDPGIYFEIDSLCPQVEPFLFLATRKFKVKTQKMCKHISQGLLMAASDFGWTIGESYVKGAVAIIDSEGVYHNTANESKFLTQKLGVTYYDPEDVKRKSMPPVDEYKKMQDRHQDVFRKPFIKKMMKFKLGRKILLKIYGKKKSSWPAWVAKTDEERCLLRTTKVLTDHGPVQIGKLVNQQLAYNVLSVNANNEFEWKPITSYQKYAAQPDELVTIKYNYYPSRHRRAMSLCCTQDHKVLTPTGYVPANQLHVGDTVFTEGYCYDEQVLPALYGMLLGDSNVKHDTRLKDSQLSVAFTQGEAQIDYLKYKISLFTTMPCTLTKCTSTSDTWIGKSTYKAAFLADPVVSDYLKAECFINNTKTVTTAWLNRLTAESLAFWYMDDGSLSTSGTSYVIRFATEGFTYLEQEALQKLLKNKFDFNSTIFKSRIAKDGRQLYGLRLSNTCVKPFLRLITPYMCKSMVYKTLPEFNSLLESSKHVYTPARQLIPTTIKEISLGQNKCLIDKHPKYVFDIEVADNHNFFADGILTHNCQNMPYILEDKQPWIATEKIDGTSTTFTMKKTKFGKNEFYICSRNVVFDKPQKENLCYYDSNVYTEMAEKYNIENVLKKLLKEFNCEWVTIQGETFGAGIQKRDYGMKDHDFRAFNLITSNAGRFNSAEAEQILSEYGIKWVPIVDKNFILPDTVEELLDYATGPSVIDGGMREGIVFRTHDGVKSFKAVSNEFLLKYHA